MWEYPDECPGASWRKKVIPLKKGNKEGKMIPKECKRRCENEPAEGLIRLSYHEMPL